MSAEFWWYILPGIILAVGFIGISYVEKDIPTRKEALAMALITLLPVVNIIFMTGALFYAANELYDEYLSVWLEKPLFTIKKKNNETDQLPR